MENPADVAKAMLVALALVGAAAAVLYFGVQMLRRRMEERAEAEREAAERFEMRMMRMVGGDGGGGFGGAVETAAPADGPVEIVTAVHVSASGDRSPQDLVVHRLEGMGLAAGVERAVPLIDGRRDGVVVTLRRGRQRLMVLPDMPEAPGDLARYGAGYDYVCLPLEAGEALVARRLTDFLADGG